MGRNEDELLKFVISVDYIGQDPGKCKKGASLSDCTSS